VEWGQQYNRYCRDCEYWEGISNLSRKSKDFKGIQGTCHRWPPCCYQDKTGQWVKPVTLDSDGCGEFRLIIYLQKNEVNSVDIKTAYQQDSSEQRDDGLLNVRQVVDFLNVGVSHIHSMRSSGQIPLSIKLGSSVRWNKRELLDWIQEGCPPLQKWEVFKKHRGFCSEDLPRKNFS
jgi:predicted DNA-binding transcriptional regulator AlpA